jgi:hypothetical protein
MTTRLKLFLSIILVVVMVQVITNALFKDTALYKTLPVIMLNELSEFRPTAVSIIGCKYLELRPLDMSNEGRDTSFSDKNKVQLVKYLSQTFETVSIIDSDSAKNVSLKRPMVLNYGLCYTTKVFSCQTYEVYYVLDDEGSSYMHSYSRKLVWILFGWYEIERKTIGIS